MSPTARPRKLHIPRPAASGRSRPFRCSSSPNSKRFAGLLFGSSSVLPEKSMQKRGAGREIALTREKAFRYIRCVIVTLAVKERPSGSVLASFISLTSARGAKARPLRCSSFPKHKRFAGLCFGFLRASVFAPVEYLTYGSRKRRRVFRLSHRTVKGAFASRFVDLEYSTA